MVAGEILAEFRLALKRYVSPCCRRKASRSDLLPAIIILSNTGVPPVEQAAKGPPGALQADGATLEPCLRCSDATTTIVYGRSVSGGEVIDYSLTYARLSISPVNKEQRYVAELRMGRRAWRGDVVWHYPSLTSG
jgi:hypothetical protein